MFCVYLAALDHSFFPLMLLIINDLSLNSNGLNLMGIKKAHFMSIFALVYQKKCRFLQIYFLLTYCFY